MEEEKIKCPKCGSMQLTANKKGFSGSNAFAGAILTGGIGLLAGTVGSNKIVITCLNCGNTFAPGQKVKTYSKTSYKIMKVIMIILLSLMIIMIISAIAEKAFGVSVVFLLIALFFLAAIKRTNSEIKKASAKIS